MFSDENKQYIKYWALKKVARIERVFCLYHNIQKNNIIPMTNELLALKKKEGGGDPNH